MKNNETKRIEKNWAEGLLQFYTTLMPASSLPNDVQWLYPQRQPEVVSLMKTFFQKFFNDSQPRTLLLGINPGRFGAGVTGVNFTAPKQLVRYCDIPHPLSQTELSAEFIYEMIQAFGGASAFYQDYFIGSVCPLGFVKGGKNINYYDEKELQVAVEPFIVENLHKLLALNVSKEKCICIGGEKNYKYLSSLNEKHQFFKKIIAVPHPRFIMQYRRKQKDDFIIQYLQALTG
ncbi:MAG: uracil-DNA glycosylase family protein [Chitinophagaceae bacterium]